MFELGNFVLVLILFHLKIIIFCLQFLVDVLKIFVPQPLGLQIVLQGGHLLLVLLGLLDLEILQVSYFRGKLIDRLVLLLLLRRFSLSPETLGRLLIISAEAAILV